MTYRSPWMTEELDTFREPFRRFLAKDLAPHAERWRKDKITDRSAWRALGEMGALLPSVPEAYGGLGASFAYDAAVIEDIETMVPEMSTPVSVHSNIVAHYINQYGNDEQKKRFLPPMARGDILGAFALSEPEAGSDAAALTTQAVRDGDYWVLNGTKSWVTSGNYAGAILTMARTDSAKDRKGARGIGTFIVTPDLPGFHVGKKEDKLGLRASPTVQLTFDNLRVPAANLLGEPQMGFVYAMQSLENGRLGIAAQAVGIARAALEAATAYAGERHQFSRPIREFQAIQFKLADMATRIAASRTLLHAAARAKDRGENVKQASSMAKLFASETAMFATNQAVQIFGGYGYVKDYPVERLFRDAKVTEIYEGTSEIQRIVIAREQYSHE